MSGHHMLTYSHKHCIIINISQILKSPCNCFPYLLYFSFHLRDSADLYLLQLSQNFTISYSSLLSINISHYDTLQAPLFNMTLFIGIIICNKKVEEATLEPSQTHPDR